MNEGIGNIIVVFALKIIGSLLIIVAGFFVGAWIKSLVERIGAKRDLDTTLARFFANIARYAVIAFAIIMSLGVLGVETTSFAALIGATGLAVGLALQGSLGNVAAGVMIIAFRPFKVGDFIVAAGASGTVQEVGLFTTTLLTPDYRKIIAPNGSIFGSVIENVNTMERRRCDVPVGVEYSADLTETRNVLTKVVEGIENKLEDPAYQVVLTELADSSVNWVVRVWVNTPDFWAVKEKLTFEIKKALDEANIGIPFPQMDVHLDRTDGK